MKILPIIFSIALFCSAFLSFSVQPILGKMLLPIVGGAPAGWIVAMAFFQLALLGGYGISYLLGRLSPWKHAAGLLILYVAGFLFLPPHLPEIADDMNYLDLVVFKALAQTILMPFLALTATTAALQRVFSATRHSTAKDPYYLFVASNVGSFVGLFVYPFLLEPSTGLSTQTYYWQRLYAVVISLIITACIVARFYRQTKAEENSVIQQPSTVSFRQMSYWIILAFIPCSLSMGVTTLITTDMPGIPLFWVIPLGLYLLTFVLAFAKKPILSMPKLRRWQINAIGFWVLALGLGFGFKPSGNVMIFAAFVLMLLEVFFINAWACHRELASLRPQTDKLPLYYFMLALGGSLAGIVHAFIIPFVLKDVIEFPIAVLLCLSLHPEFRQTVLTPRLQKIKNIFPVSMVISLIAVIMVFVLRRHGTIQGPYYVLMLIFVVSFMITSGRPRLLFLTGIVVFIGCMVTRFPTRPVETGRNFFGSYAVYDFKDQGILNRYFFHGNTLHGLEPLDKKDLVDRYHSTYYARGNPIADVLKITNTKTWAVIGLGSGQLACYDPKLTTDFYEIDQDVEKIARKYFTYLTECPPRDILIGDGRLKLKSENRHYDVIILDAFSSDGIPIHLLTKEALALYKSRLNENGVLLFHISNRYLELAPPIAAAAKENNLTALLRMGTKDSRYPLMQISKWVAVPLKTESSKLLLEKGWENVTPSAKTWTDDRSSLLDAISFHPRVK